MSVLDYDVSAVIEAAVAVEREADHVRALGQRARIVPSTMTYECPAGKVFSSRVSNEIVPGLAGIASDLDALAADLRSQASQLSQRKEQEWLRRSRAESSGSGGQ